MTDNTLDIRADGVAVAPAEAAALARLNDGPSIARIVPLIRLLFGAAAAPAASRP